MSGAVARLYTILSVVQGRFVGRKDRGATAVEYGLLVGLIAVVIIATVGILGGQLDALFQNVSEELPAAPAAG